MNGKYWQDYSAGYCVPSLPTFTNQLPVNKQIEDHKGTTRLQTDEVNPLTVRLLVTHQAIADLKTYLENRTAETQANLEVTKKTIQTLYGQNNLPSPSIDLQTNPYQYSTGIVTWQPWAVFRKPTGLSPTTMFPRVRETSQDWEVPISGEFESIKVHMALYSFFTNFAGVLDRLAHEVRLLYLPSVSGKELENWTWGRLLNEPHKTNIRKLDANLSMILDTYQVHLKTNHVRDYRHVMAHQGYLPMSIRFNQSRNVWEVMLPQDPDASGTPFNVNAFDFSCDEMRELLNFLDNVYDRFLKMV